MGRWIDGWMDGLWTAEIILSGPWVFLCVVSLFCPPGGVVVKVLAMHTRSWCQSSSGGPFKAPPPGRLVTSHQGGNLD